MPFLATLEEAGSIVFPLSPLLLFLGRRGPSPLEFFLRCLPGDTKEDPVYFQSRELMLGSARTYQTGTDSLNLQIAPSQQRPGQSQFRSSQHCLQPGHLASKEMGVAIHHAQPLVQVLYTQTSALREKNHLAM